MSDLVEAAIEAIRDVADYEWPTRFDRRKALDEIQSELSDLVGETDSE